MPGNYPEAYDNEKDEYYTPWPPDANEKPFMTYEKLMKGAQGKAAK